MAAVLSTDSAVVEAATRHQVSVCVCVTSERCESCDTSPPVSLTAGREQGTAGGGAGCGQGTQGGSIQAVGKVGGALVLELLS